MFPLKYLSNFCWTLGMPFLNCEISIQLKRTEDCILVAGTRFWNSWYKTLCLVVVLSTQDNIKLLKQLEPGFKTTTNWNKLST